LTADRREPVGASDGVATAAAEELPDAIAETATPAAAPKRVRKSAKAVQPENDGSSDGEAA
jgi:hypothetical protein